MDTKMATKLRYFNTQGKVSITVLPPTPSRGGGFVFVFPLVFLRLFPKVGAKRPCKSKFLFKTSTIYVLSSRARIMREKRPLSTRNLMLKYEKFNAVMNC